MKNIIKYSVLCLILPIMMLFSACSCVLGVCTIQFETWDGSEVKEKSFEPGYELSSDDFKYTEPTKTGYNFVNWCYEEDLAEEISFPMYCDWETYTYYAKYELDMDYFNTTSYVASWSSSQNEITIDDSLSANGYLVFLLDKTTLNSKLNKIKVEATDPTPGQGIFFDSMSVYDENGKPVADKNDDVNVFEPDTDLSSSAQFKYVIKIVAGFKGGDFKVTIN